jgi:hypothetical protein
LSKFAIFSSYTFLIFLTCSLTSVETTVAYILESGAEMAFNSETQSKSEDKDDIEEKEGNG